MSEGRKTKRVRASTLTSEHLGTEVTIGRLTIRPVQITHRVVEEMGVVFTSLYEWPLVFPRTIEGDTYVDVVVDDD